MKISGVRIEVYEDERTSRVMVDASLAPVALGHGTWLGGRQVRVETSGPGDRAHVEVALKTALDELERK